MEKSKAQPLVRSDRPTFYKHGWFVHFKYGMKAALPEPVETLITAATIGTRKEQAAFSHAVDDVLPQVLGQVAWRTNFVPAGSDPCVQVADYCAWAIQRKWERSDRRSYDLIRERLTHESDLWRDGLVHHY